MITRLTLVSTTEDGVAILIAKGEIDMSTAPKLGAALTRALTPAAPLIVNLSRISFMDSSGLHALAKARREADARDARLLIVTSPAVTRVFELADAQGAFNLHPALSDALRLAYAES